jgi:hypothetical protein
VGCVGLQEVINTLRELASVSTETNPEIGRGLERFVVLLGQEQMDHDALKTTIREISRALLPHHRAFSSSELVARVRELVAIADAASKERTVVWRGSVSDLLTDLKGPLSTYDLRKLAAEILPLTCEEARPLGERDAQNAKLRSEVERNLELEKQIESLKQRNKVLARAVLQIVQLSNTAAITEIMSALET